MTLLESSNFLGNFSGKRDSLRINSFGHFLPRMKAHFFFNIWAISKIQSRITAHFDSYGSNFTGYNKLNLSKRVKEDIIYSRFELMFF